jgi:hypothetical protein
MVPDDPDKLLSRAQAAAALTNIGYPVACATSSTKATRGDASISALWSQAFVPLGRRTHLGAKPNDGAALPERL